MILRQDSGEQCCVCPHEGVMLTNRAWFCRSHYELGGQYLSNAIASLRTAMAEPEAPAHIPEPVTASEMVPEPSTQPVRPPARRPKADRTILRSVTDKELRAVVSEALDRGWVAWRSGNGHVQLHHPDTGGHASTSTTRGSKGRGVANLRAAIARGERRA